MVSHIRHSIIRTADPKWKKLYIFLPLFINGPQNSTYTFACQTFSENNAWEVQNFTMI